MSYFAVLSGQNAESVQVAAGKLVPIAEAQAYVANLASRIAASDGAPSFFWDDNETGTSHELICDAEEALREKSPHGSALVQLIEKCARLQISLRVWWADNNPEAFIGVPETRTPAETHELLQAQVHNLGFALHPNYSLKRTADVGLR